jgi:hypothetical protein
MPEPLIPVQTIRYKTYVKETLVEALRAVFASHPDTILAKTKVGIDFPNTEAAFPAVVIRFYERSIYNAGVAHRELLEDPNVPGRYQKYKHYLYKGDIEFAVYGLSSYDRDIIGDSVVQTIAMGDLENYTSQFYDRIYNANPLTEPYSIEHYININSDKIQGFGETQQIAPWQPEDVMVYQTSYRVEIFGEFYSRIPPTVNYGMIERVETYPYMPAAGEDVPDPDWSGPDDTQGTNDDQPDPAPWR